MFPINLEIFFYFFLWNWVGLFCFVLNEIYCLSAWGRGEKQVGQSNVFLDLGTIEICVIVTIVVITNIP